ncbi:MAG: fasciclin domain-containing protein [Chitinophagaceae bacterium]|nr:fasciclin domain-containing protein [Chitinophagaceae bacterium]
MMKFRIYQWLLIATLAVTIGCKKDWDQHNTVSDGNSGKSLKTLMSGINNLSKFEQLLAQSSYANILGSSKSFTVFAPTNEALISLDPTITNDTSRLNKFLANHIADLRFLTTDATDTLRVLMLNGKYNNFFGKKVEEANITTADVVGSNGVIHVIDKMVPNRLNIWEIISTTNEIPALQQALLLKLNYQGFDPSKAEQTGVDPITGLPVYKPGTGIVPRNKYWDRVYDLRNEKNQYTFFAIADDAYTTQLNTYKPFFVTGNADSTNDLAGYTIVKDFTMPGLYTQAQLPDTLLSKFGVKVPVNKANIVKTVKASNGIVYVLSNLSIAPVNKFMPIVLEGENYSGSSHDRRSNTFFRDRINSTTGLPYRDVLVSGHGVALFNLRYRLSEMPSMKFKAYWVAVNDFQTATFTQRLAPGVATSTVFPYTTVAVNNQTEVLIGEFTIASFQQVYDIFLVGANSTTAAANPVVCDYIKLVPSL